MALREALLALQALEETIALSGSLVTELKLASGSVKKAYLIAPAKAQNLTQTPCFLNWPDAANEERMGNFREDAITVQVDFYAPDTDKGPEVALAFFDATWAAFDAERKANRRLDGTVDYLTLRGERPLLETLEWNGKGHPGFHVFLDLVLMQTVVPV